MFTNLNTYFHPLQIPISVFLAFSFILGILTHTNIAFASLAVIPLAYSFYLFFAKHPARLAFTLLIIITFCIGCWRYNNIQNYMTTCIKLAQFARPIRIEGTVSDITSSHMFLTNTHLITREKAQIGIPYFVRCNIPEDSTLLPGDSIAIDYPYISSTHSESFLTYLLKSSITAIAYTKPKNITLLQRPAWSMPRLIHVYKEHLIKNSMRHLSPVASELFQSLFFGKKSAQSTEFIQTKEQFKKWGISHLLARSGLHLFIFLLLWQYGLSVIPLHTRFKSFILLTLVLLYALMSINAVSFLRSLILFFLYQCCIITGVPHQAIHLIAMTCLIMLFLNPFYLFFLDFQLSFCFSAGLIWIFHHKLVFERQT